VKRVLAVALLVTLLVAACGGPSGTSVEAPGTLRLQVSGEREEAAVFETVARAYEAAHPGLKVVVDVVPDEEEHLAKLSTGFAAGSPADAFVVNYRTYAQFVQRGAIEPAGPLVAGAGLDLTGHAQQPLDAFTQRGELQCVPINASSMVAYINLDLLKRAGVPLPTEEGWDWESFRAAAIVLTNGEVKGVGIGARLIRVAPFVWSTGGEVVDDPVAPTRTTFDTPEGRRALSYLVGLVRDDSVVPSQAEVKAASLEQRFAEGRLAMLLSSRRDVPRFREVEGLQFAVVAPPRAPGGRQVTALHTDGVCVSKGTGRERQAADLAAFFADREGQQLAALSGRVVPVAPSARAAFLQPGAQPLSSEVFLDQLPTARALPAVPGWGEVEDVAKDVLEKAFYADGYTVEEAARDLDARSRAPLAEARR